MKRIAMISEHASPLGMLGGVDAGGQNVYVGQLASALARLGFEVDVFTRRDRDDLPEVQAWRDGVRIVNVPAGPACSLAKEDMLPCMPDFTAYMRDNWSRLGGYDLIHANFWMSGLVAADLKRTLGVPFVITFHALGRVRRIYQQEADRFPDQRLTIEDRIVAEADRIIAECPQDRLDLLEHYAADPERIAVVPCGVDLSELRPMAKAVARRWLDLPEDEPVILQLGRLVPRKGVDTVIRALGRLRAEHGIAARLLIVGGESEEPDPEKTPEIGRLSRLAAEEGVTEQVTFTGRRSRECLPYYYGAADVFVTTPWYEPFGMTPLEAMACARPVIGAGVGGIAYTVVDGETGHLVPPNDETATADRLAYLLDNPKVAESMGRRGLARVKQSFTWGCVADQIAANYEVVCDSTSVAASPSWEIDALRNGFDGAIEALTSSRDLLTDAITEASQAMLASLRTGGKVLLCGNGGSAADAQHFAGELMGRFQVQDRRALPAISLTSDTTVLTAWANDAGYDDVFARQVSALGQPEDVVVGISTSGRSANVLRAFEVARERGLRCIALTGRGGGPLAYLADTAIVVPSDDTQRIQEVHGLVIHLLCELIEHGIVRSDAKQEFPASAPVKTPPAIRPETARRKAAHAA
jgi:phosphoheptose isomerase